MDRRVFIGLAAAGLVAAPGVARAQQTGKLHRIGFLSLYAGPGFQSESFRQGMHDLGYTEGRNVAIEYRFAAGNEERLREMAAELVQLKMELIVAAAAPAVAAAMRATSTIPIVMAGVADPIRLGFVRSLAHRGASTTQILLEEMRAAARQLGIQLVLQEVGTVADLAGAFAAMERERAQALVVPISPFSVDNTARSVELATQHRLPSMYEMRGFVDAGGLVSYGPNILDLYRRTAFFVDKILKGAKPADLPVEQPTRVEMVINMKTTKTLGLGIPQAILARADQVIQ